MAKKPSIDAEKMLGAFRKAPEVSRAVPLEPASSQPAPATSKAPAGSSMTLDSELHQQLKVIAATQRRKMLELLDEIVADYLKQQANP